ncbi:MAG TPA: ABC transporter substrate-binding protein [Isosphaeraceae bacterium]|nr:ABC transporter substrate-binding protein [Isosphaeraceae bacterium]
MNNHRETGESVNVGVRCRLAIAVSTAVVLIGMLGSMPFCCAQDAGTLPVPGTSDLLRAEPFDRLTLIDNSVFLVEPVSPRPLPPIEGEGKRKGSNKKSAIPPEGNIIVGVPTKLELPGAQTDADGVTSEEVRLHLFQAGPNEVRDFKVKRTNIKKIEYFEDLLLQECARQVTAHDYARAFECCLRVQARNPGWPKLDEHVNEVLFSEGSRTLLDGDSERGLRLLRELLGRKRDYPGLLDQIAGAYSKRIERALKIGLYARGRRVLHELEEVVGEHSLVKQMRALYVARAAGLVKDAEAMAMPERLDVLTEALRIWPELDGALALYEKAFAVAPTVDVAVIDVATPVGPWIRSPADARVSRLLYRPILDRDDEEALGGRKPGQLASAIETSELGRRLLIRIRSGVVWSDLSRPVSAIDVARALVDRTDPHSPGFEARWAELLDRVEMTDEIRVEVRLHRAPLRVGAWLLGPIGPAHASVDGRVATSSEDRPLVTDGDFWCPVANADYGELRLQVDQKTRAGDSASTPGPEPKNGPFRVKRIREKRLSLGQTAAGVLRRGDVTLVEHVPSDQVAGLADSPEIKVGTYAQPIIHLIAIDGRNPALRNRALRRALSYAADRKVLLEDHLLKHSPTGKDTVADGPFAKGSYADAPGVKPLESHPWLAKMLVAAARKELGGQPIRLKFEYPAIAEVKVIVEKLAESFRVAGLEITTTEVAPSRLESELRAGRRFDLVYRILRCDEPVLGAGVLLCPGYDAPAETNALASGASPRILQLLIQLERAGEWVSARALAIQIDRESRDELPVIPLWQLADHYAWRDRLKGPAESASELYQGIETWEIAPWVARDPWNTH